MAISATIMMMFIIPAPAPALAPAPAGAASSNIAFSIIAWSCLAVNFCEYDVYLYITLLFLRYVATECSMPLTN